MSDNTSFFKSIDLILDNCFEGVFFAIYFVQFFLQFTVLVNIICLVAFWSDFLTNVKFLALNICFNDILKTFVERENGTDNLCAAFLDLLTLRIYSLEEDFSRLMPFDNLTSIQWHCVVFDLWNIYFLAYLVQLIGRFEGIQLCTSQFIFKCFFIDIVWIEWAMKLCCSLNLCFPHSVFSPSHAD